MMVWKQTNAFKRTKRGLPRKISEFLSLFLPGRLGILMDWLLELLLFLLLLLLWWLVNLLVSFLRLLDWKQLQILFNRQPVAIASASDINSGNRYDRSKYYDEYQ